jgi:hypothetical protein
MGESLMLKIFLIKSKKGTLESTQRNILFRTMCDSKGKCCKVVIDSGNIDNLVSTDMVENLGLHRMEHYTPYKVSRLQKRHHILESEQCKVEIQIGGYKYEILCDIMSMDVCHILLGRPCQYDRKVVHGGRRNTYALEKDGHKNVLLPLKDEGVKEEVGPSVLLMSGKELLQEIKKWEEVQFSLVGKPRVALTNTNLNDLSIEIQELLDEFVDIIFYEFHNALPPIKNISHHIEMIPGEGIPNKATYRTTPKENDEIRTQVQELLDKGLVRVRPCVVPIFLSPNNDGS